MKRPCITRVFHLRSLFTIFGTISYYLLLISCNQVVKDFQIGTYGYDKAFFENNYIEILELTSRDNLSRILIVPAYQGRVMTSTSGGNNGRSYGWINYSLIESGDRDPQFNAFGGEERFWLGPEGGRYISFARG